MKTLIIYDSLFGNTEKIAKAIGAALNGEVKILAAPNAHLYNFKTCDLLIVGSPTHGGMPTGEIQEFLKRIPDKALKDIPIAAFDTRFATQDHGLGLRIVMGVLNFAAKRIANGLKHKGGKLIIEPTGFIVEDKEGPLKNGELARANTWAKKIEYLLQNP